MKAEILQEMRKRAASYVPEWTQNTEDIGAALMDIYADMHEESLLRFETLRQKRSAQFCNRLGADQKPAVPATGYVTFGLSSDEVAGVVVRQHAALRTSKTRADGMPLPVETVDDVFVTPAELTVMLQSKDDFICKSTENYPSMLSLEGENMQEHALTLFVEHGIDLQYSGVIALSFYQTKEELLSHEKLVQLIACAQFSYSTAEGYRPFDSVRVDGQTLLLHKNTDEPIAPVDEGVDCSILITTERVEQLREFTLRDVRVRAQAEFVKPDAVYALGAQFDGVQDFYPFGERVSIYNEVYFACEEALRKKGARVEMDFILDFEVVAGTNLVDEDQNYKLVMNKKDVKQDPIYDIIIEEVCFEYFNGYGFVSLFPNKMHGQMFSTQNGTHRQRRTLSFDCPMDLQSTIVNGVYGRFLRVRVMQVSNAFKLRTRYLSPVLSAVNFSFAYQGVGNQPHHLAVKNNVTETALNPSCFDQVYPLIPFQSVPEPRHCVYLGFSHPLSIGPTKILFDIAFGRTNRKLIWQYYGQDGFVNLDILDQTDNLAHTGIITLKDLPDHAKIEIFGESAYYLRIINREEHGAISPVWLQGIHLNSVAARATQSGLSKLFSVTRYGDAYSFDLGEQHIHEAQVYVDETENLHREQLDPSCMFVDENERVWVRWNLGASHQAVGDRVYYLDRTNGILQFPPQPKLPAVSEQKNIRVDFSIGGGADTNFAPREVLGLELSLGFINQAENLLPFFGGTDREPEQVAKARATSEFRHKMRAVTAGDYENLVQYYSSNVSRVRCYSNVNRQGEAEISQVTLVVLTQNYAQNNYYFDSFRDQLQQYLADKTLHGSARNMHIIPPNFIKYHVKMQIKVANFNEISHTREDVQQALSAFLNPITGNFHHKGFDIGEPPKREQIEALILDIKSVLTLKNLVITGEIYRDEQTLVLNQDDIAKIPFVLPQNGTHEIQIELS